MLEAGDNVRNGGLSQSELGCGFGHAAALHDREKDLQVPEPQAPTDMVLEPIFDIDIFYRDKGNFRVLLISKLA